MSNPGMATLYARALLIPKRGDGQVPVRRLLLPGKVADPGLLGRYAEVCGFRRSDRLPPTFPHIVAFPMAMALMTKRDFPYRLPGLVHIVNRVEQLRPIAPGEALSYRVEATQPSAHPKGVTFDILAEAEDRDGAVVWRTANTFLRRGASANGVNGSAVKKAPEGGELHEAVEADLSQEWSVPGDIGRRYGAVSGDRNPIHLHPLGARMFGFPRAIAHGMWTKARCLAALEDVLPDSFTAQVWFRAPVMLPARVAFRAGGAGPVRPFELNSADGKRHHLYGRIENVR
ncbi:MaoC family dehydratase [Streptomyces sp. URMC 129]|uniref:MaoC family dehydratase n=1 Tax=Streptomyces sp. URMC 129 TaxID=3423407 RepID=UPI003F1B0066